MSGARHRSGLVAALEVGGTHVSGALVDASAWGTLSSSRRAALDPDGTRSALSTALTTAAHDIGAAPGTPWGVAMPDPFDYDAGIALFEGVGKFGALYGTDIGALLRGALGSAAGSMRFVNDADAFALGEWCAGAARGTRRTVGITLGTGVGSGWLVDGRAVSAGPGVPPGGRVHRVHVDGVPLEDLMSRRALRSAYAKRTGDAAADVHEIAERARAGEAAATSVLESGLVCLGQALAPLLREFAPEIVVIGGSIARSWDLVEPMLRSGLGHHSPALVPAEHPEDAPLFGAAFAASGDSADADQDARVR